MKIFYKFWKCLSNKNILKKKFFISDKFFEKSNKNKIILRQD